MIPTDQTPPNRSHSASAVTASTATKILTRSDFAYEVPPSQVAQFPADQREAARLLVRLANGSIKHTQVKDLAAQLSPGTLLIVNDSKVFPSRLMGRLETGGGVELFLLEEAPSPDSATLAGNSWRALGRPLRKLKAGTRVHFPEGVTGTIQARDDGFETPQPTVTVAFAGPATDQPFNFGVWLDHHGSVPLPPYIKRPPVAAGSPEGARDAERYQTVYATERGSVAAPTAGLHFTPALLQELAGRGIQVERVCLHVGGGTFLPVKSDDLAAHAMHRERYRVPRATAEALVRAKVAGHPVIAVGTTTLRSLEAHYRKVGGDLQLFVDRADHWVDTDLFIFPKSASDRYKPWVVDGLFTNFHQPESTLLMLVSALLGLGATKQLYQQAIAAGYRLFSYGDTSLLWL